MVEDGEHHMGILEQGQVGGEEGVHGTKADLVDHGVPFLLTVISVDLEWGLTVVLGLGFKEGQGFQEGAGEEEVEGDQCNQTMSQGYLVRTRVHQGRRIWNRVVMVKVGVTIKWEETQWQGIIGIRTFLHLDTDSLGGVAPDLACQGDLTLVLTLYLHNLISRRKIRRVRKRRRQQSHL